MPEHRRFLVLANELAGAADAAAVEEALGVLRSRAPAELVEVGFEESVDPALASLSDHTLVVAGGDGTLHVVVAALWRRDELARRSVGLIPLGTGNDVARSVGIPMAPSAAARLVIDGEARPMDLVEVNDEPVVNAIHVGLGVSAARAATPPKLLGRAAYAVGGMVAGLTAPSIQARVVVDGDVVADGPVSLLAIMSGFSVGGGTALCPPARPDDGALDAVVVDAMSPRRRAGFGVALRRGAHLLRPEVQHRQGERVEVVARGPVDANLDGDVRSLPERWTARVVPAAWKLVRAG